jgi:hypothetical protein
MIRSLKYSVPLGVEMHDMVLSIEITAIFVSPFLVPE